MTRPVTVLLGPPGTGKTTRLLNVVEERLKAGIPPERIAYVSFSRKAAREAATRAAARFDLPEERLVWFRTLHSAAYRLLELKPIDVMNGKHYQEMGEYGGYGFDAQVTANTERLPLADWRRNGDRCLQIYALARARMTSVEEEWRRANYNDLTLETAERFAVLHKQYRASKSLVDFTAMLDACDDSLDVDALIIDEAQDLTNQQWRFVRQLGKTAKEVWIAGDDDQAIYGFSGSTTEPLLAFRAHTATRCEVLPHSYRLPRAIHALATRLIAGVQNRIAKHYTSKKEEGQVTWITEADKVDLSHGTWLLLTRCRAGLEQWVNVARAQNVVYQHEGEWSNRSDLVRAVVAWETTRKGGKVSNWDKSYLNRYLRPEATPDMDWMVALEMGNADREYIRGLRRRQEPLSGPGRVVISTIHEAKGGEADNVALLTDTNRLVSKNTWTSEGADNELRVLYVAITRAKHSLYLVKPHKRFFYTINT